MKQTLAQIQEETLKRFLADFEYRGFSELGWWTKDEECRPMQIHHIEAFLTQSNLRVLEKVKTRILSGMKPYTIKADKSVRVADLTTEQFESSVNSEEFWWEDESDLSTLIEQK